MIALRPFFLTALVRQFVVNRPFSGSQIQLYLSSWGMSPPEAQVLEQEHVSVAVLVNHRARTTPDWALNLPASVPPRVTHRNSLLALILRYSDWRYSVPYCWPSH